MKIPTACSGAKTNIVSASNAASSVSRRSLCFRRSLRTSLMASTRRSDCVRSPSALESVYYFTDFELGQLKIRTKSVHFDICSANLVAPACDHDARRHRIRNDRVVQSRADGRGAPGIRIVRFCHRGTGYGLGNGPYFQSEIIFVLPFRR